MGKLLRFLVLACVVQAAGAQGLFKGFIPDENGTNLDAPKQQQNPATGKVVKDCAECPEMVVLPAGSFLMGSDRYPDEQPPHSVSIPSFLIGRTEVTQGQWYTVMGGNPSANRGQTLPVENVNWSDVQQFILKLNQKTGQRYRLPSEAEWEYAARAGSTSEWSFGNDWSKLGEYAWYSANSGGKTQEVGKKLLNAWGLYDMYGNVSEWTQDCLHFKYLGAPTDGSAWNNTCDSDVRIFRGGSATEFRAEYLRSASRNSPNPLFRTINVGFRLARDL